MKRYMIEKKEGEVMLLLGDHIEVVDKVLCVYVTEYNEDGPYLVGAFREFTACWEERSDEDYE
jgi:hypothetical protein